MNAQISARLHKVWNVLFLLIFCLWMMKFIKSDLSFDLIHLGMFFGKLIFQSILLNSSLMHILNSAVYTVN